MSENNEVLRPFMELTQIAEAIGDRAIFKVETISALQGTGEFGGRWVHDGEGVMTGTTQTEPPMRWSVQADYGLNSFKTGQVLAASQLMRPGNVLFTLESA